MAKRQKKVKAYKIRKIPNLTKVWVVDIETGEKMKNPEIEGPNPEMMSQDEAEALIIQLHLEKDLPPPKLSNKGKQPQKSRWPKGSEEAKLRIEKVLRARALSQARKAEAKAQALAQAQAQVLAQALAQAQAQLEQSKPQIETESESDEIEAEAQTDFETKLAQLIPPVESSIFGTVVPKKEPKQTEAEILERLRILQEQTTSVRYSEGKTIVCPSF